MSVNVVIKTPPSTASLTQVKTYTPAKSTVASAIYQAPNTAEKSPAAPVFSERATASPSAPTLFYYLRNNRLVGVFNSAAEAQLAMDFHASREFELGADI